MKKNHCIKFSIAIMSTALCYGLCGCCLNINRTETDSISAEITTADRSVLTERQKKILKEEGLPTDIDELTSIQKNGIMNIENAFLYLDEKYPEVEFEFDTFREAWIMGQEKTYFYPKGYDKDDERNLITVEKDRDGNYDDNNGYALVIVRDTMEEVVTEYAEAYFGEGNVKVYVYPYLADMEYDDEINENTIKDKVKSTAVLFVPDEICTPAQLDAFSDTYKSDGHDFDCRFRATIIRNEDFNGVTFKNCGNMYDENHTIYDIDIK